MSSAAAALTGGGVGMRRYAALDGLRGIAALSVVLLHLQAFGMFPLPNDRNHAVDLFFMMSGFVIAGVYERQLPTLGVGRFVVQRLARLHPTYALSLAILPLFITAIAIISTVPVAKAAIYQSMPFRFFYLPSPPAIVPPNRSCFLLNGPGWSLLWELVVNILYATLLPILSRRVLIAIVAAAGMVLALLCFRGIDITTGSDWPTFWMGALRVVFGFPLGVLLWRSARPRFDTPFPLLALMAAATLFLPSILSLLVVLPSIVWLATGSSSAGPLLGLAGELSYPLYAVHVPLIEPVDWFATRLLHLPEQVLGPVLLVALVAASWLVLTVWDRPVRESLRARITGSRQKDAPAL